MLCKLRPLYLLSHIIHTHPTRNSSCHIYVTRLVHWLCHLVEILIKILSNVLLWRHNIFGLSSFILISQLLSGGQQALHNIALLLMVGGWKPSLKPRVATPGVTSLLPFTTTTSLPLGSLHALEQAEMLSVSEPRGTQLELLTHYDLSRINIPRIPCLQEGCFFLKYEIS